ncbi:LysR substrate-binding domain-containing protein, partial [Zoogloea sp.]|uniref:LysR substrate-binding domain-containing protein n=1 Tax=Zoogloea sp. TaxID=49181 RepID=UPI0025F935A4
LFRDRFIGVVREGHLLCQREITPARYAAGRHVLVARQGVDRGPVDEALKAVGLERQVATTVGGFSTALALVRSTDLIASVPERHTGLLRAGLFSFALPVPVPEITVSMLWHPRLDGGVCGAD